MLASNLCDSYEFPAALTEVQRAIALNPSNAQAHLYCGCILGDLNRPEEAFREFALTEQLDPVSTLVLAEQVSLHAFLGRYNEARKKLDRLGDVEQHGLLYHDRRAQLALATGDSEGLVTELEWFEERLPGRPEVHLARAIYEARVGHSDRARALLASIESLPEAGRPTGGIPIVYAMLGELDDCFRWIERGIAEGQFSPRGWLYDPLRARARADPRFSEILRRMHIAP